MNKKFLVAVVFSLPAFAGAGQCQVDVASSDQMRFDKSVIEVSKSCPTFNLTLNNSGTMPKTVMGHNIVIVKKSDADSVARDAIAAGAGSEYVKAGDTRIIAHTKMLGGGEKDTIAIDPAKLQEGEEYLFFCSFPGHRVMMSGSLLVKK